MAKVLITGASGFVGNNLTRHVLTLGQRVNLLLRDSDSRYIDEELELRRRGQ